MDSEPPGGGCMERGYGDLKKTEQTLRRKNEVLKATQLNWKEKCANE